MPPVVAHAPAYATALRYRMPAPSQPDYASATFVNQLLGWFDKHGRHDLPWQHPRTPYRVWLSEIMLQQTQVSTAAPYFLRFLQAFPTLPDLAAADNDAVMAQWAGLGYYARARNLHAAAQQCVTLHGGELPRELEALNALPGIGRSTAGAILSQAWNDRHPILDGNVKRVLTRFHGIAGYPGLPAVEKQLWAIAEHHVQAVPDARLADYTQAQMDLGATLCTRSRPTCAICPLQHDCVARRDGRVEQLPTPKPGKAIPERSAVALLIRDAHGNVLLNKRPPVGIWASLWTLPQADDIDACQRWFQAHVQGDFSRHNALPEILHAFSHYRLRLQPLQLQAIALHPRVSDNDDLRWVSAAQLTQLGLPAPIRKLLRNDE